MKRPTLSAPGAVQLSSASLIPATHAGASQTAREQIEPVGAGGSSSDQAGTAPTRRGLLMNVLVSTAAAMTSAALPVPSQAEEDVELVALADLTIATYGAWEKAIELEFDLDAKAGEMLRGIEYVRGDPVEREVVERLGLDAAERRVAELNVASGHLMERVIAAKATTPEGVRAKIAVLGLVYHHGTDKYDEYYDGYKPDLVCSLMRDLGIAPRQQSELKAAAAEPLQAPVAFAEPLAEYPPEIFGKVPKGFVLDRQPIAMLNFWHEKAFNLHLHAKTGAPSFKLGKSIEGKIYEIAVEAEPNNMREAVAQFDILARQALSLETVTVIGVEELMVLVEGLKKTSAPIEPKKYPGKPQRGRKLTRAGLLLRYQSFLVQELETLSWNLYGESRYAFRYRISDDKVDAVCRRPYARRRKSYPFFDESKLTTRARGVLGSLEIDTEYVAHRT